MDSLIKNLEDIADFPDDFGKEYIKLTCAAAAARIKDLEAQIGAVAKVIIDFKKQGNA